MKLIVCTVIFTGYLTIALMSSTEKGLMYSDDDINKVNERLVFNPYNPLNTEIQYSDIISILEFYGIPVNDLKHRPNIKLYKRACIHRSYTKRPYLENDQCNIIVTERPDNCMALSTKSNERLEFLGDGVLECITKYYLYRRFPKENEGFMTEKKIALVKNEAIGRLAMDMGLHRWLIISKHAEEKHIRYNIKKLGCLFESFLGALFLDFNHMSVTDDEGLFSNIFVTGPGFQMAQIFVENIYDKHVDWIDLIKNDDNYKNIFQVKIQKAFKTTPHYVELEHDIDRGYTMGVYLNIGYKLHEINTDNAIAFEFFGSLDSIVEYINSEVTKRNVLVFFAQSMHKIKKKAEQSACKEALELINSNA
jgi:dsRNA-specific ribonuclease